jgi:hypothetical protein
MKGVVFNLLETLVRRDHGEEAWDAILDAAGVEGAYTSLGNYDDAELFRLVGAAAHVLQLAAEAVVRWFGRSAIPLLADHYPHFFERHHSTRSFLLTLNSIIHPEVRKMYPGANVPEFDCTLAGDELILGYRSTRQLCTLAEGFIEGAADLYREQVRFDHHPCMKHGAPKCVIRISFHTIPSLR